MPLLQSDDDTDLNSFIDVAIRDDGELNPIVDASRRRAGGTVSPLRISDTTQKTKNHHQMPQEAMESPTGTADSPSTQQQQQQQQRSRASRASHERTTPWRKEQSARQFGESSMHSISLSDMSSAKNNSKDLLLALGDSIRLRNKSNADLTVPQQQLSDTSLSHDSFLGLARIDNLKAQEEAEHTSLLEQEVAKLRFELADAKAEADFHKLQHRHLHIEFQDLQAFCEQLQEDNKELRSAESTTSSFPSRRNKKWFKSERIRKLCEPRQLVAYSDSMRQVKPNNVQEELSCAFNSDASDEYWDDDDTLTTNFGGTLRDESTVAESRKSGPLLSLIERTRTAKSVVSRMLEVQAPAQPETPTDITVDVKYSEQHGYNNCNGALGFGQDSITEFATEESESDRSKIPAGTSDSHPSGFRMDIFMQKFRGFNAMKKTLGTDILEEESVNTVQTTKTMPEIGRRFSSSKRHRYAPKRRMSSENVSSVAVTHDLQDLDLDHSNNSYERARKDTMAELVVSPHEESILLARKLDLRNGKPGTTSLSVMPRSIDKSGQPFQSVGFEEMAEQLSDIDEHATQVKTPNRGAFCGQSSMSQSSGSNVSVTVNTSTALDLSTLDEDDDSSSSSDLSLDMPNDMSVMTDPSDRAKMLM